MHVPFKSYLRRVGVDAQEAGVSALARSRTLIGLRGPMRATRVRNSSARCGLRHGACHRVEQGFAQGGVQSSAKPDSSPHPSQAMVARAVITPGKRQKGYDIQAGIASQLTPTLFGGLRVVAVSRVDLPQERRLRVHVDVDVDMDSDE